MSERANTTKTYTTCGGVEVTRQTLELAVPGALDRALVRINTHRGCVFASGYEYPGRYSRWDMAFVDPPLEIVARHREFSIGALNERGTRILKMLRPALEGLAHLEHLDADERRLEGRIQDMPSYFPEEERSKQPTIFSVMRSLVQTMKSEVDPHLGFYGAMGYDLVFQFEPIELRHRRDRHRPDLHLFLPDELIVVDHRKEQAHCFQYDFAAEGISTAGIERCGEEMPPAKGATAPITSDHRPGEYAEKVKEIIAGTERGDFFEVVLSQVLSAGYPGTPKDLFENIRQRNPSPYEFLINLGDEQLIGASPEMFVRVEGSKVETCPISGTVQRGVTPMQDAQRILELLNSAKDEAELTMCTDVDRNDKSRVCEPGSVQVEGRRLIEIYSRLIHTVDYVVGVLKKDCDGFDALLSHMWACTLTGAPKPAAMQRVEDLENSAREWYGGCVGMVLFNGDINTGITIRTVDLREGIARVRAGATLLCDSDPEEEELETRTKAEAFINAVVGKEAEVVSRASPIAGMGTGKRVLFVDNRDSFVHTLANYVRQTGAEVTTVRAGFPLEIIAEVNPGLVFISPGPGTPAQLGVPRLVRECVDRELPMFGVCLGLQGLVEGFGGELDVLSYPMHGKMSTIQCEPSGILRGFPREFTAGRYHSLFARQDALPACFDVLARTEDGVIMAIEHRDYPAAAVQFHPESILTLEEDLGLRLIGQVVQQMAR